MHLQAEYGAAAHFAYAEAKMQGASSEKLEKGLAFKVTNKMSWVNQLAGWREQVRGEKEVTTDFSLDAFSHHIYVFSPKGDVYDLPENSTPVDFAYNVHSDLGEFIQSAKINGKIAQIDATLKSGDVVEIIKTKSPKMPSKNWLRFVKSQRAKLEIKKAISAKGEIV